MKKLLVLLIPFLLSGCLLESVGPIDRSIKPYGAHWVKKGMTMDLQRNDWVDCGGDQSGSFSPSINTLSNEEKVGISREQTRKRLEAEADSCMINRGYKFIRD
jgi:hypothetical protein